jgi:hypothetical protein
MGRIMAKYGKKRNRMIQQRLSNHRQKLHPAHQHEGPSQALGGAIQILPVIYQAPKNKEWHNAKSCKIFA